MIDNLEDAIAHAKDVAENWESQLVNCVSEEGCNKCLECVKEHEQLANWLTELKEVKDIVDHWNDKNSSFVSATIAFEKILDVFKGSETTDE